MIELREAAMQLLSAGKSAAALEVLAVALRLSCDDVSRAPALLLSSVARRNTGDIVGALDDAEDALELYRQLGDDGGVLKAREAAERLRAAIRG